MSTVINLPPSGGRRPIRLNVEKHEALVASGAFSSRDSLELIEGVLVVKRTQNPSTPWSSARETT